MTKLIVIIGGEIIEVSVSGNTDVFMIARQFIDAFKAVGVKHFCIKGKYNNRTVFNYIQSTRPKYGN